MKKKHLSFVARSLLAESVSLFAAIKENRMPICDIGSSFEECRTR